MAIGSAIWNRVVIAAGLFCVAMTLLLLPLGLQSVRAENGAEALMIEVADAAPSPGMAGLEIQPGLIRLNTRGYNYGPMPAELDPAAIAEARDPR